MRRLLTNFLNSPFIKGNGLGLLLLGGIIAAMLFLTVPILPNILPHPDEHQFFFNAFSIMGGKQLHNYLHVALTEYALAVYLSFMNLMTKTGVNFPQGDPSVATYFYGRIFGLILYLLTFLVAAILLQKKFPVIRPGVIFFAVLFFGSVGMFERFLRVNSDSMSIFVILNFILVSLIFHEKRARVLHFFFLNVVFVFLASFTNLKALYMVFPMLLANIVIPYVWYSKYENNFGSALSKAYGMAFYFLGMAGGIVALWYLLIPKQTDPIKFWYNIKNATVRGVGAAFEYPTQAYKSWAVYLYDLVVQQIGLTQFVAILLFLAIAFLIGRKKFASAIALPFVAQVKSRSFMTGNLWPHLELILLLTFVCYYIGVSSTIIHWSRWGAPLGILALMLISTVLELAFFYILASNKVKKILLVPALAVLFLFSWSLMYQMVNDIKASNYPSKSDFNPSGNGFNQTYKVVNDFINDRKFTKEEALKKIAWYTGYTNNVGHISLDNYVSPEWEQLEYILWPYWNIGVLYADGNVDQSTHNIKSFVNSYGEKVEYRFPNRTAEYMHQTKMFAWKNLGITWNPEIDSLVEPQFAIVTLRKDLPKRTMLTYYEVENKDLDHVYSSDSRIFNLKTLKDTYILPPCATNPDVFKWDSGNKVDPPTDIAIGGRTNGLWCHSLWFRVFPKGQYEIKIEGLPDEEADDAMVYSTQPIKWDHETKTIHFSINTTIVSTEFGIATKRKHVPDLKFTVSHYLKRGW